MAKENKNNKGQWQSGDIEVTKIVFDGKVIKNKSKEKKKDKK